MAEPPEATPTHRTQPLPDEAAVIARAVGGDRTAFAQIMEHYQSACYGLAWRLLNDADQAADATQDAFIHAYRAIGSYRGACSARGCCGSRRMPRRHAPPRPASPGTPCRTRRREASSAGHRCRQPGCRGGAQRALPSPGDRASSPAGGAANRGRAVRRLWHGLQRGGGDDTVSARHGEVADPPWPPAAARAAGRSPGTVHVTGTSGA